VGLGLSFAASGFAAQMSSKLKKITSEMVRKIRIGLLQFDFIVPSNSKIFYPHPSPHALNMGMTTEDILIKTKYKFYLQGLQGKEFGFSTTIKI
jgi:hypothetical protein